MIEGLGESCCDEFFRHLDDHRSDNGNVETGYFMPVSQSESRFPHDNQKSLPDAMQIDSTQR
jgi:hypothetical protein